MSSPVFDAIVALDDDFNFFSGQKNPPDEGVLGLIERDLGWTLAPEHRRFMARCGCAAVMAKEEVWPRPEPYEIRPRWQMIHGVEIFGAAPAGHPLSVITRKNEAPGELELLPVAALLGVRTRLCVTRDGRWVYWDRDGVSDARGFDAELLDFLRQLAIDKDRIKTEGVQRS